MQRKILNAPVIVGALGYFVDIYDLLLFGIVRMPSLKAIGVPPDQLLEVGIRLLNMQMIGTLVGGLLWGILGDKRGRLSVLFGSIFLYSVANLLNGMVQTVDQYAVLRFLAGVGLAGELGAAITLVSEVMHKEVRGYGTAIVASVGICGAVVAAEVGNAFDWRVAYYIGGGLGLGLLVLRVSMVESGMYAATQSKSVKRGDFLMLFQNRERVARYLSCILVGLPIWFVIGILITFAPELGKALGVAGDLTAGDAIKYSYIGLAIGDLSSGLMSQWWRSRKKVMLLFLLLTLGFIWVYASAKGVSPTTFYWICGALGFSTGYWAIFVSNASEQFGTNLRNTVASTAPNFVRGAVALIAPAFRSLIPTYGAIHAALIVGMVCMVIAFGALYFLKETFGRDLDYLEIA